MVRDAKKYGCPPCMYQIRSKLLVLPATGNSHWSNPDAICHQMSITPHQKDIDAVSVSLESMNDVDLDGLASDLRFVLKAEQKEAVEKLLRGKDVFDVLPTSFGKSLIFQLFVLAKNSAFISPECFSRRVNKIIWVYQLS